jgi:hypothetical protein
MSHGDRPHYRLLLRVEPGEVPEPARLRQMLKALLRRLGLRCLSFDPVPAPDASAERAGRTKSRPGAFGRDVS